MKKHRDADALAARIAEAANQPAAIVASAPKVALEPEATTELGRPLHSSRSARQQKRDWQTETP
jgi:hypothetical protein